LTKVLVTGATGYIGSRLIPALIDRGHEIRMTSRQPDYLKLLHPEAEAVPSDVSDIDSLRRVLDGIDVAYYLVHSMGGEDFESKDRRAASNFLEAATAAGVSKIVYLGGLGRGSDLSTHLRSRHEVGQILASGDIEVVELRAAIVIGSGSVAFEMLRHLTDRLPAMIAPKWLETRIQPIGEADLIAYLVAAGESSVGSRVVEVGGSEVLTYRKMLMDYARERGLRRVIVGVPVLTPRLSSYWVTLVTPVHANVARSLIDSLRNEVVVTDNSATEAFPDIHPSGYVAAVRAALAHQIEVLDTGSAPDVPASPGALEGMLIDRQEVVSRATADQLASHVMTVGGDPNWYPLKWAWWVRARLDDLFGGSGLRWTRPQGRLEPGAKVDWWTVEDASPRRVLLRAEMKVPGEAWLEWRSVERAGGAALLQTAYFRPRGVLGYAYWWGLYVFHYPIFRLMARRIAERAAQQK
jgi:uncharacterized protein YbjT (DUF2867 family)